MPYHDDVTILERILYEKVRRWILKGYHIEGIFSMGKLRKLLFEEEFVIFLCLIL